MSDHLRELSPTEPTHWEPLTVPGWPRIAAGRRGTGGSPTVILLHGLTATHRSFNAVARHLDPAWQVVAPDLRGRGNSEKPMWGYGLSAHSDDVLRLVDHLGVDTAVLVGHSMGGYVALAAAMRYPSRFPAVLLLDSGWPRVLLGTDPHGQAPALLRGIPDAQSRILRLFASEAEYANSWNAVVDVPIHTADQLDSYRYEIERVPGGWRCKALIWAVMEDSRWLVVQAPSPRELRALRARVGLVRAGAGFVPGSTPVITESAHRAIGAAHPLTVDVRLPGASHYTMLFSADNPRIIAEALSAMVRDLSAPPRGLEAGR